MAVHLLAEPFCSNHACSEFGMPIKECTYFSRLHSQGWHESSTLGSFILENEQSFKSVNVSEAQHLTCESCDQDTIQHRLRSRTFPHILLVDFHAEFQQKNPPSIIQINHISQNFQTLQYQQYRYKLKALILYDNDNRAALLFQHSDDKWYQYNPLFRNKNKNSVRIVPTHFCIPIGYYVTYAVLIKL